MIFARNNGQKRKLTASQGSRTVVIVVVRMLVFVNILHPERSNVQASPRVPWMCGYSLPRTALSLASPCAAHRRGDSWYGLLVNRHVRPKISGPCTCSTSFSQCRSQHTFARKYVGQQCGNANCRSWHPYVWSDKVLAVCCGPRHV